MTEKIGLKKAQKLTTKEELLDLNKDELVARLLSLQAHNQQLKNIINKNNNISQRNKQPKNEEQLNKKQKGFDFTKYIFRHVLLKFYYLGWDYQGYVVQEDTTNTIEHFLFEALLKTCLIKNREESNYHRCGRTDKGVSSFSQVISINLRSKLTKDNQDNLEDEINYCQTLNRVLPENIQCIAWMPVEDEFSARFDCKFRSYKYFFPKGTLNIEDMKKGCEYLIGAHDFRNLCKMDVANGVTEFIRSIERVDIKPSEDKIIDNSIETEYSMYIFNIRSKGFLWHQIRCIMGILFLIGEGKESPEVIKELLDIDKNPRKPDYNMASEVPLNLFHCEYDCDTQWQYDFNSLQSVIKVLQGQWTIANVKSTMMKAMLSELENIQSQSQNATNMENDNKFANILNCDNKTKRYVSLMNRPKCDSLAVKVEHYLKRRKLEIKKQEEPSETLEIEKKKNLINKISKK